MSLNGLDSPAVIQAHQAALIEAGGWFLLKYTNRDTVDLLSNGNGGIKDVRSAVEQYEEKSPLYGLVNFRRKRIILKYVPDGTSRLLQVRLAVQFQSVTDTIIPHDTVFSFTHPEELSDSSLGLFTMHLQVAVSPTSSVSSLRNRRLKEIAEDAEENATPATTAPAVTRTSAPENEASTKAVDADTGTLPASAVRAKALLAKRRQATSIGGQSVDTLSEKVGPNTEPKEPPPPAEGSPVSTTSRLTNAHPLRQNPLPFLPDQSRPDTDAAIDGKLLEYRRLGPPSNSSDDNDDGPAPIRREFAANLAQSEHLSLTESSNISRWTDDVFASTMKHKSKRAPRKVPDFEQRPKTSGTIDSNASAKRVANLPTSIRVASRQTNQPSRPGSQQSSRSVPMRYVPPPNLPPPLPSPTFPADYMTQNPLRSRQPPPSRASSGAYDGPAATPEKMRLMKALQMRKRNQLVAQKATTAPHIDTAMPQSIEGPAIIFSNLSTTPSVSHPITNLKETQAAEVSSIHGSHTTSPTSIITSSEHESTKPSSVEEKSVGRRSKESLSSGTDSSTTPRVGNVEHQNLSNRDDARSEELKDHSRVESDNEQKDMADQPQKRVESRLDTRESEDDRPRSISEETRGRNQSNSMSARSPSKSKSPDLRFKKRHDIGQTIQTSASTDDANTSDDDSFMDELQNATVYEAKPMSVSRTPITPILAKTVTFPSSHETSLRLQTSVQKVNSPRSEGSTPDRKRTVSRAGSAKSVSTALPQWPPPPPTEPVPTVPKQKLTVGTTISKRIKALEGLSKRDSSGNSVHKESLNRMSTFSNLMKRASFVSQFQSSTTTVDNISPTQINSTAKPHKHEAPETSASLPRPWLQRPGSSTEILSPSHRGDTVSVTAQIVRDNHEDDRTELRVDPMLNMHRSPLMVEHETHDPYPQRPAMFHDASTHSLNGTLRHPLSDMRRFSFSSRKSTSKRVSPAETVINRMSFTGSKKSKPPSEASSIHEERRQSRTSRMLRRLSGLTIKKSSQTPLASPTREYTQPETIDENFVSDPRMSTSESLLHIVDIGEANVQFPETLLWKRRFLRVDDQGYLIFAPTTNDLTIQGRNRKFHLGDINAPALPDSEREEMAWSIVLDLIDGRTVQCACENKESQRDILKMLTDAHDAYHQLYTF